MSEKFGRNYRLTIDPKDGGPLIVVGMPMTCEFTVERHVMAQLNTSTIEIYNLAPELRNRIFQDRYVYGSKNFTFEVGYDSLYTVFQGDIFRAGSYRSGPDIITHIEGLDGLKDTANTMIYQSVTSGKTLGDIFKFLIGQFPSLRLGAVGAQTDKITRPAVFNGNVWDILQNYTRGQIFVDLGNVFVLQNNEVIEGQISELSVDSGLLETPRRDENELVVTTLLEPRVAMGQLVSLKSSILPVYNGEYKVNGLMHTGIISAAVGRSCRSTFNLFTGPQIFGSLKKVG